MPYYYHTKFGGNWTTNKGETGGGGGEKCAPQPIYMVPKDPSLNKVNCCTKFHYHQMEGQNVVDNQKFSLF